MKFKGFLIAVCVFAVCSGLGISARSAHAQGTQVTCRVSKVAWTSDSTAQFYCDNAWYFAFVSTSGTCVGVGMDAAKAWLSLGQSAMLSAKKLFMLYNSSSIGNCVSYVQLTN